jgi:hypothetical protein
MNRENHPTLGQDKDLVLKVLYNQFKEYEKPTLDEADNVNDMSEFNPYCLDLTDKLFNEKKGCYDPYWIVGDAHGCFDEFIDLELEMNKDSKSMKAITCISVGDLIDKGPDIALVLKHFINIPNYYACMGNHENKLLRHLMGNKVNTSSLKETIEQISDMDKYELALWLMTLPKIIKVGGNFIFHAGMNPTKSIMKQNRAALLYARKFNPHDGSFIDLPGSKYWHEYIDNANAEHRYSRRFFGHHYHSDVTVAYNTYALDGHCVYGKELRGMLMPERKLKTVKAKKQYKDPINSTSYYDDVLEPSRS